MTLPPWHVPGLEAAKGHKGFLDEVTFCVYLPLLRQAWHLLIWQQRSGGGVGRMHKRVMHQVKHLELDKELQDRALLCL